MPSTETSSRTLAPLQGLNDAACADTGRLVCAVNRTIPLVDLAGTDTPLVPGEQEALARSVRVGGNHCVSAGHDGTLRVWDLRGLDAPSIIECAPRSTYQSNDPDPVQILLDATPTDGRYAAAVTYAFQADFGKGMRTLLLVDLESGEVRTLDSVFAYWPYHHDTVLVSDQRLLVSAQYGTVGVWDLATGERLRTLDNAGSSIVAITATFDGSGVIAAMGDRRLAGWKLSDGTLRFVQTDRSGLCAPRLCERPRRPCVGEHRRRDSTMGGGSYGATCRLYCRLNDHRRSVHLQRRAHRCRRCNRPCAHPSRGSRVDRDDSHWRERQQRLGHQELAPGRSRYPSAGTRANAHPLPLPGRLERRRSPYRLGWSACGLRRGAEPACR